MAAQQPLYSDYARLIRLRRFLTWLAAIIAADIAGYSRLIGHDEEGPLPKRVLVAAARVGVAKDALLDGAPGAKCL